MQLQRALVALLQCEALIGWDELAWCFPAEGLLALSGSRAARSPGLRRPGRRWEVDREWVADAGLAQRDDEAALLRKAAWGEACC